MACFLEGIQDKHNNAEINLHVVGNVIHYLWTEFPYQELRYYLSYENRLIGLYSTSRGAWIRNCGDSPRRTQVSQVDRSDIQTLTRMASVGT